MIFVGDSLLYDVVGARAAGIISVLYAEVAPDELKTPRDRNGVKTHNNPGVEPDFVIGDLTSVPYVRPKESRRRERDPYSRPTLASETGPSNLLG